MTYPQSTNAPAWQDGGAVPAHARGGPARWEWRTFDYQPQRWQEVLSGGVRSNEGSLRSETYLITPQCPSDVKLRDGVVEVKHLVMTDPDGLERWRLLHSEGFPMTPDVVAALCHVWQCDNDIPEAALPTAEHLFAVLARHATGVRIVPARKWRRSYQIHGCAAERATVLAGGALLETLSLEHEDPAALRRALRLLRLDREPNTSYPLALRRLFGWVGESSVRS